ncbi:MAG: PEP-CTERM sorting domain-containing protein [Bryobacterales bacterium]
MFRLFFAGAALAALAVLPSRADFLLAGVEIDGYVSECTTGAPYTSCVKDDVISNSTPGTGQFGATNSLSLGSGSYDAGGAFAGYLYEPYLTAFAGAGSDPAAEQGYYLWTDASGHVRVIQGYTYGGLVPAMFQVQTDLEASIVGDALNQVFANISIFDAATYDPTQEILPLLAFDGVSKAGLGTDQLRTVSETLLLDFELQPGQAIYMIVDLSVTAASRSFKHEETEVDAEHTLRVNFVGGPTDLLTPAITGPNAAVPEPSALLLFGAGLLGLAWTRRRH